MDTSLSADGSQVNGLVPGPTGKLVLPQDPDWDAARAAWAVNVDQQPAAVAVVRSVEDVSAVVASAARAGLKVMAQGTGHGAHPVGSMAGTVLIRTAGLNHVTVDASARVVSAGSGAEWRAVSEAAAEHGCAVQAGSSPDVGIAGYLLSGGLSWLARSHGLAVNDVVALEVVGADGVARVVDAEHDPDLFWALRGGGGSFGVVTRIDLRMHPQATVVAGTLFFPMPKASEVLHAWRQWTDSVSDQTTSCGRLLQFPPMPEMPEPLRGQAFVAVEVAHAGDPGEVDALVAPLRELGPTMDTIAEIPTVGLFALHMDPPDPVPFGGGGMLLSDVGPQTIDAMVASTGSGSGSPLLSVELRHLGGAVAQRPDGAGAVGHFDAPYVMYAVGFAPDPDTSAQVATHLRLVAEALAPWAADVQYANFDERAEGGRERFHDGATLERLRVVRSQVDPDGLFTGAHALT